MAGTWMIYVHGVRAEKSGHFFDIRDAADMFHEHLELLPSLGTLTDVKVDEKKASRYSLTLFSNNLDQVGESKLASDYTEQQVGTGGKKYGKVKPLIRIGNSVFGYHTNLATAQKWKRAKVAANKRMR